MQPARGTWKPLCRHLQGGFYGVMVFDTGSYEAEKSGKPIFLCKIVLPLVHCFILFLDETMS